MYANVHSKGEYLKMFSILETNFSVSIKIIIITNIYISLFFEVTQNDVRCVMWQYIRFMISGKYFWYTGNGEWIRVLDVIVTIIRKQRGNQ